MGFTARAEDKEKKARKGLRVTEDKLQIVREELQAAMEELCAKTATLDRVSREALEAESSVELLTEKCNELRGDFQRQEALVSQRDGVIAELGDEACTLWASGWLAFQRKAIRVFLGWTSIFKFLVRRWWKNSFLRTR